MIDAMVCTDVAFLKARLPESISYKDGAERELIGACIDGQTGHLLRRHVSGTAENRTIAGQPAVCCGEFVWVRRTRRQLAQAEIHNLGPAIAGQHDVLRFEIAVNDFCAWAAARPRPPGKRSRAPHGS